VRVNPSTLRSSPGVIVVVQDDGQEDVGYMDGGREEGKEEGEISIVCLCTGTTPRSSPTSV